MWRPRRGHALGPQRARPALAVAARSLSEPGWAKAQLVVRLETVRAAYSGPACSVSSRWLFAACLSSPAPTQLLGRGCVSVHVFCPATSRRTRTCGWWKRLRQLRPRARPSAGALLCADVWLAWGPRQNFRGSLERQLASGRPGRTEPAGVT